MPHKRLYDLLNVLPVDKRTLLAGAKSHGIKVIYIGKSGPLVSAADYQRIETKGIPYYKDKMTKKGIR